MVVERIRCANAYKVLSTVASTMLDKFWLLLAIVKGTQNGALLSSAPLPSPAFPSTLLSKTAQEANSSSFPKAILAVTLEIFVPSWILFRKRIS